MNKETELIELLSSLIGNIDAKINLHKKFNQPINILGDAEIEMLHACMYDTLCMGSGGQGWDTDDHGESKGSNFLQSRNCNGCKEWDTRRTKPTWKYRKVMFFLDKCPYCGSHDLQSYTPDARFGISAKSHLEYIDELKGYRLTLLEPEHYNADCRTFRLRTWFVETKNEYLTTYAQKQFESPKSNLINFQPLKADFYRSKPCLHLDLTLSSDGINITYFDINNTIPENIPTKYLKYTIDERMSRKSFGKNRGEVIR